ncbi:MAG TPA: hypothetical protein PLO41_03695 [Rubrivivax sp.]|nr:hypothetical protein [Rubrivivax sp.]
MLDTNVLVYADAADVPDEQARAAALIEQHLRDGSGVISKQLLHALRNAAASGRLERWARFPNWA